MTTPNTTLDVKAFRAALVAQLVKVGEEAERRMEKDPNNVSWSYTIRDNAVVTTLNAIIVALDAATHEVE